MREILLALGSIALPLSATAHHSRAEFTSDFQELEGELISVDWSNPHPTFELQVEGSDGAELWEIQGYGSLYTLRRAGVTGDYFRPGDPVRLAGRISTKRENLFLVSNLLLPDGREVVFRRDADPVWQAVAVGGAESFVPTESDLVNAAAENRGIFRLWSRPDQGVHSTRLPPFTAAATASMAAWDALDDTSMACIPKGMPMAMTTPHPYEFVDDGDSIKILGHEFNIVRTIHMNDAGDPSAQPLSHLGYSVGRWEGDILVVETSRINWPLFSSRGVPQSEAVEIVERYTLSDDQSLLSYETTITDPGTFVDGPVFVEGHWVALGETPEPYDCKVDE